MPRFLKSLLQKARLWIYKPEPKEPSPSLGLQWSYPWKDPAPKPPKNETPPSDSQLPTPNS